MDNWEEAKKLLDHMKFPDTLEFKEKKLGELHETKNKNHSLLHYDNVVDFEVGGFPAQATYNYCPECAMIMNKYLIIFNNATNSCYQKYFTIHGKTPGEGKLLQEAAKIFSSFILLAI